METYKLVVIVVKPFLDSQKARKGLRKQLVNLETLTQEVIKQSIPYNTLYEGNRL